MHFHTAPTSLIYNMATRYRVLASSQQVGQKQQSMDLVGDPMLGDPAYAQRCADSYAMKLNSDFKMHTCDWVGSIEPYEHVD
jgi:hypothetical protein